MMISLSPQTNEGIVKSKHWEAANQLDVEDYWDDIALQNCFLGNAEIAYNGGRVVGNALSNLSVPIYEEQMDDPELFFNTKKFPKIEDVLYIYRGKEEELF